MAKKKKAESFNFEDDAGLGFENVEQTDLGIPFLSIAQSLSPEIDEESAKFIDGCKPGMIFNSLTRLVLGGRGEPVVFVPCSFNKAWVEWMPRESGGGFVRQHTNPEILTECKRNDRNQDIMESGNVVVTTVYIGGLIVDEDNETAPIVISFTSTQLKKARQWLSIMMSIKLDGSKGRFTPPMYSHKYDLSTVPEENASGKWFGWKIELVGLLDNPKVIEAGRSASRSAKLLTAGNQQDQSTPF